MYYDIKNSVLLLACPGNGFNSAGALVQGLDLADAGTQADCGYLQINSDTPAQPENTVEDVAQRIITVNGNTVTVVRTWVAAPIQVPATISARQVRLWLVENNISLSAVQDVIDAIVDAQLKQKTQIEWEFAPYIERTHPLIEGLGASLGLAAADIDAGFIAASQL